MPIAKKQGATGAKPKSALKSAWDFDAGLKINVYGRSGTGKTRLWSTFPDPILAGICSASVHSGELRSIQTPENRHRIDARIIQTADDARVFLDEAKAGSWKTVVLDHVTGLQDFLLKEVLGVDELPAQMGWGVASQEQWGKAILRSKEILRHFLNLPCNVVLIGQERNFGEGASTEEGGEQIVPYVATDCSPSLARWIGPACDYVVRTFVRPMTKETVSTIGGKEIRTRKPVKGQFEFCLGTGPDAVYLTKFRVPTGRVLPDDIVDPSYDRIMEVVEGRYKE